MSLPSARFAAIYDSLPLDVQNIIVEKQLIPLLDKASKSKRKKILASASKMRRRHAAIPVLDLRAKKREVNGLLDELHRDTKRSFVRERSLRNELLEQTVESVTCWLNDIWRVVYEHNVDFLLAHKCLIFTVNTIDQIGHGRPSCRCAFTNMYVPITIKRKSGKVVKSWQVNGAHNVEEVLQFIWRDLFLSMLATGTQRQIEQIPEMLDDIEDIMGWTALERLLYGGRKCPHDDYGPDEEWTDVDSDEEEDHDAYTDDDSDLDAGVDDTDWVPKINRRTTPSQAKHWSHRISSQMWQFRKHVHAGMLAVFKLNPSLRLYTALLSSSTDPDATGAELMAFLNETATSCPEVFAAALAIHAHENNTAAIASLLSTHAHLLRPRDAPVFQGAVLALATDPFQQQRALELIEKELLDTVACVRAALAAPFSRLDTPANRADLEQLLKLRAADRQDRVERWVDAITTPGTGTPNPMALAAMVMGLPLPIVPPLDGAEDTDPLGYLDFDPADPDTEDLREEFRPRLKARFEGWADTAQRCAAPGGPAVLLRVYKELVRTMPFVRAADVVEDMLARVSEKPGRQHVIDAVDALAAFAKVQRRRLHKSDREQKRRATATATATATASTGTQTPSAGAGPSTTPTTPPPPPMFTHGMSMPPPPHVHVGSDEVEDAEAEADQEADQEDDMPPALEPATPPLPVAPVPPPLFTFYTGMPVPPPPPPAFGGPGGWNGMDDVD